MLAFGTTLTNSFKARQAGPIWLLRLYHGSGAGYIPIAEEEITVGGIDYLGVVQSWGMLNQKADIVAFEASFSRVTIKIDNTIDAATGARFTDLYASKQLSNRKWALYISDGVNVSTDSIGSGLISDDIRANDESVTMHLLGYESKYNDEIPTSVVVSATYTRAPPGNVDKPIPMAYGDFDRIEAGAGGQLDRALVKGHFPAIITDIIDIDAKPDNETLEMIRKRNLYMRLKNEYAACAPGKVAAPDPDAAGSLFTFSGNSYFIYVPFYSATAGYEDLMDEDSTTEVDASSEADGTEKTFSFAINATDGLGAITSIKVNLDKVSINTGVPSDPELRIKYQPDTDTGYGSWFTALWAATDEAVGIITTTPPGKGAEITVSVRDKDLVDIATMRLAEITLEVELEPSETFVQSIRNVYEEVFAGYTKGYYRYTDRGTWAWTPGTRITKRVHRGIPTLGPANVEYVYYTGQGRQYGASIDTIDGNARDTENGDGSDPGYASGDLIKNPIYIVEEMLRTEAGLDAGVTGIEIDIESFDVAGASADGLIGKVFNDAVGDVHFAFSQYQFTDVFSFMGKIGQQCGTLFFISGSSKIKARVRQRPSDYDAGEENMKIDYDDLYSIEWYFSPTNEVRNDVTVKYNFDYAREETTESDNSVDATSKGSGTSGYNETLELEEIASCIIDDTTAAALGDYLLAILKDRHIMFRFSTNNPRYQALEIGDVITFKSWDSNVKVYGAVPDANDLFMVIETSKIGPNKTIFEVMEVSAPG